MQFRLLGELEVEDEHGLVQLPPGKESALLAVLVLHAGRPLATDQLVEELWGSDAPEHARKQVQIYVSRLRRRLGPDRIVTTSAGYTLKAGDEEIDVRRAEARVRAGRFREALAEWRGDALADFRYDAFAQPEVRRLQELRDGAQAELIDESLARGEAETVVPELEAAVERDPLRERPRGQLMRALYLTGRQADALEVYRDGRTTLAQQLGIEPSPQLQALERAILNHDPALGSPRTRAGPLAARRPPVILLVGAALVGLAAIAAVTLALTRSHATASIPYVPNSLVRLDARTGKVDAALPIAGTPGAVAFADNRVWVGSSNRFVSAISPDTLGARAAVAIAGTPEELVPTRNRIWAVHGNVVSGIDPVYGVVRTRIRLRGALPGRVQVAPSAGGGLWVVDGSRLLRHYDDQGRVIASLVEPLPLSEIAVGDAGLWALSTAKATLLQLDRSSGRFVGKVPLELRPSETAPLPFALAVGGGSVWVLDGSPPSVVRVDPRTGAPTNTIPLGIGSDPSSITASAAGVWVADSGDGTIAKIDPSSLAIQRISVGGSPFSVVSAPGATIWATRQSGLDDNTGGVPSPVVSSSGDVLPSSLCSPVYGEGKPDVLLAADLPLQGYGANALTLQMSNAIRFVLAEHHFRAGRYRLGYQLCDDSSASTGSWTPATCAETATAIARLPRVVGVIGPFNSGCAISELPILARSPAPLAELSPSATYVGLTHHGAGTQANEPAVYRAHGTPLFFRDVAADDTQGAANALMAHRLGVRRLVLLPDGSDYGRGLTAAAGAAARRLGIKVVGTLDWPRNQRFGTLAAKVAARHPDGVFLAGVIDEGGSALIIALRKALPAGTHLLLSDGFAPFPVLLETGPAAERATVTIALPALSRLPGAGKRFVRRFSRAVGTEPQPYAVSAAEAAETMLAAIARSNGTRPSVLRALRTEKIRGGILGTFGFDADGDSTRSIVSVYQVRQGAVRLLTTITPAPPRIGQAR